MFDKHAEHLRDSAPCNSRWYGYCRGDAGDTGPDMGQRVVGRMTNEAGQRVEIIEFWHDSDTYYEVRIDARCVFSDPDADRARAITVARWWMDGCPA